MNFGHVTFDQGVWRIECAAHVRTKLKRLFPEVNQRAGDTIRLSDNDEHRRDLLWVLERYPMAMDDQDLTRLRDGAARHVDEQDQVARLLEGRHPPADFTLALPPRDYQVVAAHNARRQNTEPPDEDADGNRLCLDCGEVIPQERVIAANAVRCIDCAQRLERLANKFAAQTG